MSCALFWIPFLGIVTGVIGLILAIMSRKVCAPGQTGLATAGLVLAIVGLCVSGLYSTCWTCAYCAARDTANNLIKSYYYY